MLSIVIRLYEWREMLLNVIAMTTVLIAICSTGVDRLGMVSTIVKKLNPLFTVVNPSRAFGIAFGYDKAMSCCVVQIKQVVRSLARVRSRQGWCYLDSGAPNVGRWPTVETLLTVVDGSSTGYYLTSASTVHYSSSVKGCALSEMPLHARVGGSSLLGTLKTLIRTLGLSVTHEVPERVVSSPRNGMSAEDRLLSRSLESLGDAAIRHVIDVFAYTYNCTAQNVQEMQAHFGSNARLRQVFAGSQFALAHMADEHALAHTSVGSDACEVVIGAAAFMAGLPAAVIIMDELHLLGQMHAMAGSYVGTVGLTGIDGMKVAGKLLSLDLIIGTDGFCTVRKYQPPQTIVTDTFDGSSFSCWLAGVMLDCKIPVSWHADGTLVERPAASLGSRIDQSRVLAAVGLSGMVYLVMQHAARLHLSAQRAQELRAAIVSADALRTALDLSGITKFMVADSGSLVSTTVGSQAMAKAAGAAVLAGGIPGLMAFMYATFQYNHLIKFLQPHGSQGELEIVIRDVYQLHGVRADFNIAVNEVTAVEGCHAVKLLE